MTRFYLLFLGSRQFITFGRTGARRARPRGRGGRDQGTLPFHGLTPLQHARYENCKEQSHPSRCLIA